MDLFLIVVLTIAGFVLIVYGGNMFVDSAIWLAEKAKIPKLIIGATIVSIGTTLPEITVSLIAAANGDVALAASNGTGSMFCNLVLILGIGLCSTVMVVNRKTYIEKFIFAAFNIALLLVFSIDMKITLWENIILLAIFVTFMAFNVVEAMRKKNEDQVKVDVGEISSNLEVGSKVLDFKDAPNSLEDKVGDIETVVLDKESNKLEANKQKPAWLMILFFIVGGIAIAIGAKFLVDNVSKLATDYLFIPTAIVGATIVAFGTSLPEFITAINAIRKKSFEMSIGNVLGANIINGTFLIGMSGLMQGTVGLPVMSSSGDLSIFISMLGVLVGLAVLILPILIKSKTFKWQGYVMVTIYVAYIVYTIVQVACF